MVGNSPRRAAGLRGRNVKDSVHTTSLDPIILDLNYQFGPIAAGTQRARRAAAQQSARTHMPTRVWIVGGFVVLLLLFFATARSWLPDLTINARGDVSTPTPGSSASTSAVALSLQQPDNVPSAIPTHSSTNWPVRKPTIAIVIPRSTLPDEQGSALTPPTDISPPPIMIPESDADDTATTPQQLDLNEIEDTKHVQQRLIDLGYLFAPADGIWGQRSRRALQDFRVAQGLGDSATWDEATQRRLLAPPEPRATPANKPEINFIGGWGVDVAQCRQSPVTITARRAETVGVTCEFHSTQQESSNVWRLRARCANNNERWNANVRFTLSGNKLTWSSERGTTTYVRCLS
jgi:peptidoglycan hydrolase-like protein with peptidoglycan-binding domain